MPIKKTPSSWQSEIKAIKRVQLQFSFSVMATRHLKIEAAQAGLQPSALIRKTLGLSYADTGRERIGVSFNDEDFKLLAKKYSVDACEHDLIKRLIKDDVDNRYRSDEH